MIKNISPLFITITLLGILSGAEIDLFVPSFPDLKNYFNISTFQVELLLSINLIGNCTTALIVGSFGDKFGRRSTIIGCLIIFIFGSILCLFATNYAMLLLGRLLQGVGSAGPAVLCFVLISDYYPLDQQPYLMGIINGITTFAIAFAPVIGSYVNLSYTWRGNFFVLLILGVVCLIFCMLSIPSNLRNINAQIDLKDYKKLIMSKQIRYYIIMLVLFSLPYYIFIGIAPILYIQDLGVSLEHFGFYQGAMALTFAFFSIFSANLLKIFGQKNCFLFSIGSLFLFVIVCIISIIFGVKNPIIITLIMQVVTLGVIFPLNILFPRFMNLNPDSKSKISALFTFIKFITVTSCLQIVSHFYNQSFTVLAISFVIFVITSIIWCYKLYKFDNFLNNPLN